MAVPAGSTLLIAGQLSVGRDGGVVGKNDFDAQMRQVLDNLGAVLEGTGLRFNHIVKFTTYTSGRGLEPMSPFSGSDGCDTRWL